LSIIVNLDYALVSDIMFKKTSSCKYYILQSMLYTLFRLEGTDESTASQLAINTLNEYKFLSMEERNKIKKSSKNRSEIEKLLSEMNVKNARLVNKITSDIKLLSDLNVEYTTRKLEILSENFRKDRSLTIAFLEVSLLKLKTLDTDRKRDFINAVESLVDEYSEKTDTEILL